MSNRTNVPGRYQQGPPRGQHAAPARQEMERFPELLEGSRERLMAVLPPGWTPERFIKVALVAYHQEPKLARCSPASLLAGVMQAAELGLPLGKPMNMAHLVPYGNSAEFQVGYKGMLALARRTGEFLAIGCRLVHEADEFAYEFDPLPRLHHRPSTGPDPGRITHAYAYCKNAHGELSLEVMTAEEIERVRRGSPGGGNTPAWNNHWGEQARKTPLKRLLKRESFDDGVARLLEVDSAGYDFGATTVSAPPRPAVASGRGVAGLAAKLMAPTPAEGPSFDAEQGVGRPLRSEDDQVVEVDGELVPAPSPDPRFDGSPRAEYERWVADQADAVDLEPIDVLRIVHDAGVAARAIAAVEDRSDVDMLTTRGLAFWRKDRDAAIAAVVAAAGDPPSADA